MSNSRSKRKGGKFGVGKVRKFGPWTGRLRGRGGALGREGALAEEKPVGGKEGKKETESLDVAGGDMTSSLPAEPQLLPGIPNKTTLDVIDVITPKLSGTDFLILSSMNRLWLETIFNCRMAPDLDPPVVAAQGLETYKQLVLQVVKYLEYT